MEIRNIRDDKVLITSDTMFAYIMQDEEVCKGIVERILGREIKKRDLSKAEQNGRITIEYSLSKDDLTDCHVDPVYGDKLCYEPDGYIEYTIRYIESRNGNKNLRISKDVPEENRSSFYLFTLENRNNRNIETSEDINMYKNNYMLAYTAVDQEYDKIAKYRYYVIKDLLNGMCKITCKDCMINDQIVTMAECDTDSEKYRSNLFPGAITMNFIETYSNDNTGSK